MKRGEQDRCAYGYPGLHQKNTGSAIRAAAPPVATEVQTRINHLENLVLSLMAKNGASSAAPSSGQVSEDKALDNSRVAKEETDESDMDRVTRQVGSMMMVEDSAIFVPATHWNSIIGEIKEVKKWFEQRETQDEASQIDTTENAAKDNPIGVESFYHQKSLNSMSASEAELLWEFPPKQTLDAIIPRFFVPGTMDPMYSEVSLLTARIDSR